MVGEKIIARGISHLNRGPGLLGVIRLDPGPAGVIAVNGRTLLAQGTDLTDLSGNGRSGTWAFPTDGSRGQVYLGPSTGFHSSLDRGSAWLTTASTVWQVNVADGTTIRGPYPMDGQLVDQVGGGLLLQRDRQVVWWVPSARPDSRLIGEGTALGGWGDYSLWQGSDGRLTITDPNTLQAWRTAVTVPPGRALGAAALSPDLVRVAAAQGATLHIGDAVLGNNSISVSLGADGASVTRLAWLDNDTLIATIGARGLVVVDATSGRAVAEPDFIFDSRGLAIIPTASATGS